MSDPRLGDHATGLELRIEESVAQKQWAQREGWTEKVQVLDGELADLYLELADTAEQLAGAHYSRAIIHGTETAEQLTGSSHTA